MHLALYALATVIAVWFVATSLVAARRAQMGRDLELHLADGGEDGAAPARTVDRERVAHAA